MRVMIAEDQPLIRERLAGLLALAGCQVVSQHPDGLSAARWLEAHPRHVDAMFLDYRMPGLSGLEVAALHPDIPPVFVTAYGEPSVEAGILAAANLILKPITGDRVRDAIARLRGRIPREERDPALVGEA